MTKTVNILDFQGLEAFYDLACTNSSKDSSSFRRICYDVESYGETMRSIKKQLMELVQELQSQQESSELE